MKIKQNIYNQIIHNQSKIPPESGGILGGNKDIITVYQQEEGLPSLQMCSYTLNTINLNIIISQWQQRGIKFMGIYHTHFWDVDTLSKGDKAYIEKILKNMPTEMKFQTVVLKEIGMIVNMLIGVTKTSMVVCAAMVGMAVIMTLTIGMDVSILKSKYAPQCYSCLKQQKYIQTKPKGENMI